jgi:hypothetical protein
MSSDDLARILESAARLGVEVNEEEALDWLTSMAAMRLDDVQVDVDSGVFGHRVSLLDFSPDELAYYRAIGEVAEVPERPGVVESALALSGSAAQSRIQTNPGDCDYFQRVNIIAATREDASAILAEILRDHVLATASGTGYRFAEAVLGSFPVDGVRNGRDVRAGSPVRWTLDEVMKEAVAFEDLDGRPRSITWLEAAQDPGWVKIDWIVAHPQSRLLANASNVIDVTWEAPDGTLVPLDGQLDPYFQEVYLDAESIPLFSKVARNVAADAIDSYTDALEGEIRKYTKPGHENWGKAAKRLYNVFRMTGRHAEAAYIRELFDESATVMYRVAAMIRSADEAHALEFDEATVHLQIDALVLAAVEALEGELEVDVVRQLLGLRAAILQQDVERDLKVAAAQAAALDIVNDYFKERLLAFPAIREYLDELAA